MSDKTVRQLADMVKKPLVRLLEQYQETDLSAKKTDGIINGEQRLLTHLHKSHEKSQADIKCVDEKAGVTKAKFDAVPMKEDKTTVEERAIESVDNTVDTTKPKIMPFNVNITETLSPVLSDLSLEQLVDTYAQVDQQSQLLKGLILLEARNRFTSNNDFGKWVEFVGTLCSDTRQARTRYMNFAKYFKDKSYTGISLTCCYEISAPINADVADKVYDYALNKNLSVTQVKEQIQIAKGHLPSNVNEATEEDNVPESLSPEDIDCFKDQILLNIAGLALHDAIRVLKACMKAVVNK